MTTGPLLGEPLPIELANTAYAVRGRPREGLPSAEHLAAWLESVRSRLPLPLPSELVVTEADLASARELRASVRALAEAAVTGAAPPARALATLNERSRSAPRWRELRWDGRPVALTHAAAPPVAAALSAVAEAAVDLFAGPGLAALRACQGPGCVLFFVKDHPRREWCSAGCGSRARAARHYERAREGR
ncbi:CGNR zinc finger domain-containing protein [Nonomuraea africana]|nr:CGNR zinc finger domain-containing protein [Nonomuraea africana]